MGTRIAQSRHPACPGLSHPMPSSSPHPGTGSTPKSGASAAFPGVPSKCPKRATSAGPGDAQGFLDGGRLMVDVAALGMGHGHPLGVPPGPPPPLCAPLTHAAGDVGGSHRSKSITAGTQVTGELSFLLLVGAGRAGDALLRLAVVIRSLRAAN